MIVYFADRAMNILGLASDTIQNSYKIGDDKCTTEVETGTKTLSLDVYFEPATRSRIERLTSVGNYLMRYTGSKDQYELYTIIDSELDVNERKINIYCEDGGLDLLNETVGPFSTETKHSIKEYVSAYLLDTGFKIGKCEIADTVKYALEFDGDETIYSRLLAIVNEFDAEMAFSFEIKNLSVTGKFLNIYKERGSDKSISLRINREISNIVVKKSVANLCTTIYPIGGIPEGDNGCCSSISSDGKRYYTWVKFAESSNGKKGFDNSPGSLPYIGLAWDQEDVIESETYSKYKWFRYRYDKVIVLSPPQNGNGLLMKKEKSDDKDKYMFIRFGENSKGKNMSALPTSASKYIGIAKNKSSDFKKTDPTGYTWTLYTGDSAKNLYLINPYSSSSSNRSNSVQGGRYAWVRYGSSAAGADISTSAVGKTYAGLNVGYSTTEPSGAANYIWSKILDNPLSGGGYVEMDWHLFGVQQHTSTGTAVSGKYTWIRFAEEDDKGNIKILEEPSGSSYIGFAYNKTTFVPSSNYKDYSWHDIKGDEGRETTLVGFKYDKGDIYVKNGCVYSRKALAKWSRYKAPDETGKIADGAIVRRISYDYTDQVDLLAAAIYDLYMYSEPEVNYEVSVAYLPKNVYIGDRVNIIDDEGQIYVSARVLKTDVSECNGTTDITLGEFIIKESGISSDIEKLAKQFADYAKKNAITYTWTVYADDKTGTNISTDPDGRAYLGIATNKTISTPDLSNPDAYKWSYIAGSDIIRVKVSSSAGYIFKNKAITTTLTAKVYRNNTLLTDEEVAKLGTINWYMDDSVIPFATGESAEVSNQTKSHTYSARLEEDDPQEVQE